MYVCIESYIFYNTHCYFKTRYLNVRNCYIDFKNTRSTKKTRAKHGGKKSVCTYLL